MSRSEAERWRDHVKAKIRAGEFVDPTRPQEPTSDIRLTVGNLADRYLEEHVRTPTRRAGAIKYMGL